MAQAKKAKQAEKFKPAPGGFPYESETQMKYNLGLLSMLGYLGVSPGSAIDVSLFEGARHFTTQSYSRSSETKFVPGLSIVSHINRMNDCVDLASIKFASGGFCKLETDARISPDAIYDLQVRVGNTMKSVIKYHGRGIGKIMDMPRELLHEETSVSGTLVAVQRADDNRVYLGTFESKDRDGGVAIIDTVKFTPFSRKPQKVGGMVALEPKHTGDFYVVRSVA